MRLCIIGNPNSAHVRRFIRSLNQRGHQIYLIGEHSPSISVPGEINFIDLTQRNNLRKLRYFIWFMKINGLISKIDPDLIHALGCASAGWLGSAARFHPFVITAMGSDILLLSKKSYLHQRLSLNALHSANHIFCLSHQLVHAITALGIQTDKLSIFYFGVDPKIFHPPSDKASARSAVSAGDAPLIVSLRAMNAIYNPLDIATAIPQVLRSEPGAKWIIFQYNENRSILEQFKSIIDRNKAAASVSYVSGLTNEIDIAQYLRAADISISIANSDGTPVSVLESMACGNAVILGDIPSLREWVNHGQEALFIPLNDPQALADTIIRLIRDLDLRQRLSHHAAQNVKARFSQEIQMQHVEKIYHELISQQ